MKKQTLKALLIICVCAAFAVLLPCAAFSVGFARPTVEYSADQVITARGSSVTSKVYSTPEKERIEVSDGRGGNMATILRIDKKLMWTLMPSEKMYIENKLSGQKGRRAQGDYQDCSVKHTEKGKEEVNGFQTRRMEIEVSCPGNEKYTGMTWLTKENIPIRVETSQAGSKKEAARVELKNLKIGKQAPALFEIPAGYNKMEMPGM